MNRTIVATLLLVLIETSVLPWLVPSSWSDRLLPHLAFLMTLYVALFAGRHRGFFFGLGFGLFQDVLFYGHLIGAYALGMGLIGYLAGLAAERRRQSLVSVGLLALGGSAALDLIVYAVYRLFQLTDMDLGLAFYRYVAPTMIAQVLLALALYVPVRRFLVRPATVSGDDGAGGA